MVKQDLEGSSSSFGPGTDENECFLVDSVGSLIAGREIGIEDAMEDALVTFRPSGNNLLGLCFIVLLRHIREEDLGAGTNHLLIEPSTSLAWLERPPSLAAILASPSASAAQIQDAGASCQPLRAGGSP